MTRRLPGCLLALLAAAPLSAQDSAPAQSPAFEVASVKLMTDCAGRNSGMTGGPTLGRLDLECTSLEDLIKFSYIVFASAKPNMQQTRIIGGPAWIRTERYTINAKTDGGPIAQMYGPMLRRLLEERFQLKLHREDREMPVYFLTVAKGGSKLKEAEGSCIPIDLDHMEQPNPGAKPPNYCGNQSVHSKGKTFEMRGGALTLAEFATGMFSNLLDRPVRDKTGLPGRYEFDLEFTPDSSMPMFSGWRGGAGGVTAGGLAPAALDPEGPTIFSALEKLGLKLEQGKAPVEVIVIDAVDKLREN